MRCPVCGALYLYHYENTFSCAQGHEWSWGYWTRDEDGQAVYVGGGGSYSLEPEEETPGNGDVSRWEGEGGHV